MSNRQLLNVESLSLKLSGENILNDISFSINQGEFVGLVGESGSGKSMTVMAILGFLKNVYGRVLFKGRDLLRCTNKEMEAIRGKEIGLICQNPMTALNPTRSIGSQMIEGIIHHQGLSKKQALNLGAELLEAVGLPYPERLLRMLPDQLSGGMRQRVVIAMAISCRPALLIADEPTTSLDVTTQAQILHLLTSMQAKYKMGVLLITHDLGIVAGRCEKILILQSGSIVDQGTPEEIFYHSSCSYTKELCWKQ